MIDFSNYIAERTKDFTGREWVFQTIDEWLARPDGARFFVVTGEPGSGKTAVAAQLAQFSLGSATPPLRLSAVVPGFLSAVHFCRFQDQRHIDPFVFTERLVTHLGNRYPAYREWVEQIPSGPQVQIQIKQQIQMAADGAQIIGLIYHVSGDSAAEAFVRVVREPLEVLLKEEPLERVTILVDSLDEALLHTGPVNIVDLLSRQEGLPQGVRFIVTTRPDEQTLDRLGQYRQKPAILSLTSQDGLASSRNDIERYVEQMLASRVELRLKLESNLSPAILASTIAKKSDGNFLYAYHLLTMLENLPNRITEQTLDRFPAGLDRFYLEFLDRLLGDDLPVWRAKHAPVIGTLAVALEALSEEQLADFIGVEPDQIQPTLDALAHFLQADRSRPYSQRTYTIYHSSFASFLLNRDRAARYWCGEARQHQRIAGFYLRRWGGLERGLPALASPKVRQLHNDYPFRYLSTHLRLGGEQDTLFALIEADVWYEAQMMADPSASAFLRDLAHARQAAAQSNAEWLKEVDGDVEARRHKEWTEGLGRELRYAVAEATIHSLSGELPAALLVALATTGAWTAPQILTAVSQIPDVSDRFETLIQLADSTTPLPKAEMLREALVLARTMPERDALGLGSPRRLALENLARVSIKVGHGAQALDAVTSLGATEVQAYVLAEIAPLLGQSGQHAALMRALKIARSFTTDSARTTALAAIAPQLARVGDPQAALDTWQEIVDGRPWTDTVGAKQRALVDLVRYLPETWLLQAETAAQTLSGEAEWVSALSWIAPRLPEPARSRVVSQVLEAIERMAANEVAAEAAEAASDEPVNPLERLLMRSGAPDAAFRGHILARLAAHLSDPWKREALATARAISSAAARVDVLADLALHLDEPERSEALREALAAIRDIVSDEDQVRALERLAPHLPEELLIEALAITKTISLGYWQALALGALAPHLPNLLHETALNVARDIEEDKYRLQALSELAPYLSEPHRSTALQSVWNGAKMLRSTRWGEVLESLAQKLSENELLWQALETVAAILPHDGSRLDSLYRAGRGRQQVGALTNLASHLTEPLATKALVIARAIHDSDNRAEALVCLAPFLSASLRDDVLREALAAARAVKGIGLRARALASVAPALPADLQRAALREAMAAVRFVGDDDDRAWALAHLASHLSERYQEEVLAAAKAVRNREDRIKTLARLAPALPEPRKSKVMRQIVWNAEDISSETVRARILVYLARHLPESLHKEALDAIQGIGDGQQQAYALLALAPFLADTLREKALQGALDLNEPEDRSWVLVALIQHLAPPSKDKALQAARAAAAEINQPLTRVAVLVRLIEDLPKTERRRALREASAVLQTIAKATDRIQALAMLMPFLPKADDTVAEALSHLGSATGDPGEGPLLDVALEAEQRRARALVALAPYLPVPLHEQALTVAGTFWIDYWLAYVLTSLAESLPGLSDELRITAIDDALATARMIEDAESRALILTRLVPLLQPEERAAVLEKAIRAAGLVQDLNRRIARLYDLTEPILAQRHKPKILYNLWQEMLQVVAQDTRRNLFLECHVLVPILVELGGPPAVEEAFAAIQAVTQRWP